MDKIALAYLSILKEEKENNISEKSIGTKTLNGTIFHAVDLLELCDKDPSIFKSIKDIEKKAYRNVGYMRQMQYYDNIREMIEDYVEGTVENTYIWLNNDKTAYVIYKIEGQEVEGVDIASISEHGIGKSDLLSILRSVRGTTLTLDARETTSYPIFLNIIRRYPDEFKLLEDETHEWGSDIMHSLVIKIM